MPRNNDIVIEDLIDLFLDGRAEQFPFEKNISLSIFCSWLFYPADQSILKHAQTVAAANVYVRCKDDERQRIPFVAQMHLAKALADPPIAGDFLTWFDDLREQLEGLDDVVNFFMRCPLNMPASLNRAYHFIEQDGFLDANDPDINELRKSSRATAALKVIWRERARTSPFVWSAGFMFPDILQTEPDFPDLLKKTNQILRKKSKLVRYFGIAKWCQERLTDRLDREAKSKIAFVTFPASVTSINPKIPSFDSEQSQIASKYKAPQLRAKNRAR